MTLLHVKCRLCQHQHVGSLDVTMLFSALVWLSLSVSAYIFSNNHGEMLAEILKEMLPPH